MFTPSSLFLIVLGYLSLLFILAYFAEAREKSGRSIVSNPYVYSLSFAVYCTSWTFYGSVGKAATSGLSFLTTYLGPTLMAAVWWIVLRKIVRIAKENRITTISDFIGSRYGKSFWLSAAVAVVALVGITPYLGLQIKSIITTFDIMSGQAKGSLAAGWFIALFLGVFAIIFGARRLDASERHEGLVFAIAFESIIKLVAFLAAGAFVTYGMFSGFGEIFENIAKTDYARLLTMGDGSISFTEWGSLLFLSMMAIMFLPRQFQIAVVENSDIRHIRKAMWLFPLYLLLINIFVLPVAFGGLLMGGSQTQADSFVLTIPLGQGKSSLALLVFLGGFSAATSMIIVESVALSTMVMNSLVMPGLVRFRNLKRFPVIVLNTKRLVILGCVFLGYFFAVSVGGFYSLVDMGLKSFEAVTLFAPAFLLGLYWKGGNSKGAIAGLVGGFAVWLYTLLIPALAKAGLISSAGLLGEASGTALLNPSALFGVAGLDKWSHSLFWSMLVNVALFVGVSIFTRHKASEEHQALVFVESYSPELRSGFKGGIAEVEALLGKYIGRSEAAAVIEDFIRRKKVIREDATEADLEELRNHAEKILSGALGPATATLILRERHMLTEELTSSIRQMTDRLRLSRAKLEGANRELNFLKEFSQNIIESVPQGIATLDRELKISYWNKAMEKISGLSKADAQGRPIKELKVCLEPGLFADGIKGGEHFCKKQLGQMTLKVTVSPFKGPQGGYVLLFEDITEKLKQETELLQASKYASIGKLTAGISHEIGNPLASISSLVQEMQDVGDEDFNKDALETVNQHIERIVRIVRSLGNFARIYTPEKVPTDLIGVLDSTLSLTRYDKRFRNIEISKDVDFVPPVKANPDQLQQVFLNILLNALDAMPEGGRLDIKLSRSGAHAVVSFKDSGVGMDRETRERVFDPFFTTKPYGRGMGMGMSICYGIIKEHGGIITVDSDEGHGTKFTIRLPVEDN